jgi:GNAT superfamily N-acetyltransferase
MPVVTVRDAHHSDAFAIGEVSAAAVPHVVQTSERVAADMDDDIRLGRRRWVALLCDEVAGTATARQVTERLGERHLFLAVQVRPEWGSQGVGTHLLLTAAGAFPGSTRLLAVADGGPISLSFAVRNGFLPESEQPVALLDPRTVAAAPTPGGGLRPVTLEALPDLRMLLETHNLATAADPGQRRLTMYQLRSEWWDRPGNAPELSWGLLAAGRTGPVLAAFTSVHVDLERGRAWSRMTATHPSYRGRGLAQWVKRRTLVSLAAAGVTQAWAPIPADNTSMLAVNEALGYKPAATSIRLRRRIRLTRPE